MNPALNNAPSRHIPEEIKRAVHERDGGQCRFVSPVTGRRCGETAWLQLHHLEGFARTGEHSVAAIELRCAAHNQYEAEVMYGRPFMEEARTRTRSGTGGSVPRPSDEEPGRDSGEKPRVSVESERELQLS